MKLKERLLFVFVAFTCSFLFYAALLSYVPALDGQLTPGVTRQLLLKSASSGSDANGPPTSERERNGRLNTERGDYNQDKNRAEITIKEETDFNGNNCTGSDCNSKAKSSPTAKRERELENEIISILKPLITNATTFSELKQKRLLQDVVQNLPALNTLPDGVNFSEVVDVYLTEKSRRSAAQAGDQGPQFKLSTLALRSLLSLAASMRNNRQPDKTKTGERLRDFFPDANSSRSSGDSLPLWQQFQNEISQFELYPEDSTIVDPYVESLATLPIVGMETIPNMGTQVKFILRLEDGGRVMFKPKRFPVEMENPPDRSYFDEFERFQAEIAAYHLDRILGFRRVPPVAGRMVNLTDDIKRVAPRNIRHTFYRSLAGNVCFYGECSQFCDSPFGVCGSPDLIEGSFASYLPSRLVAPRTSWVSPWKNSYILGWDAEWMGDKNYCHSNVSNQPPYNEGRRLLDVMDMATFDFLMGNMDRHDYSTFRLWNNYTSLFFYDNGRGFGKSGVDDLSLLTPISQCCLFRYTTLEKLLEFETGDWQLSLRMRESLSRDAVSPLLTEAHLRALDRRVKILLNTVFTCIRGKQRGRVVIDDGF